jgi:hypothetical protein
MRFVEDYKEAASLEVRATLGLVEATIGGDAARPWVAGRKHAGKTQDGSLDGA